MIEDQGLGRTAERPLAVVIDLDGTVYRGNQLIPGADVAIDALRGCSHRVVFVTNAIESCAEHSTKLRGLNIPAEPGDVVNATSTIIQYLRREMPHATVYAVSDPPLVEALENEFSVSEDPAQIDVVIASCDRSFDYRKLNIAFQALRRGAHFLATNADAAAPVEGGLLPDAGAVIGALEGCTARKPDHVVGKPSQLMAKAVLERLGRPASECLMVGDNLESDILMGHLVGMRTALVLSGVTQPSDLNGAAVKPDHVLGSIAELPRLLGCY